MRKVSIFAGETSVFRKIGYISNTVNRRNKNNTDSTVNSTNEPNKTRKIINTIHTFDSNNSDILNSNIDINRNIIQLALEPTISLLKKTGFPRDLIDAVIFSSCSTEQYLSSIISEILGIKPKISHRIDNLCNSGTNAIISAYSYIASGLCDCALVIGAELCDSPGRVLTRDISRGQFNLPIYWAAIMKKMYKNKYRIDEEKICSIPVKNYLKAKYNHIAINSGKNLTLSQVMNSKLLIDPLHLLECSMICDGASSILLTANDKISFYTSKLDKDQLSRNKTKSSKFSTTSNLLSDNKEKYSKQEIIPICIKGIGQQTFSASLGNSIESIFKSSPAKNAARQAYEMARIKPSNIDLAEIHDAFSILEIIAYEDLGFVGEGKGGRFIDNKDQDVYINPRGGILGCGHPLGATGIAQTVEIFKQLCGTIDDDIYWNDQLKFVTNALYNENNSVNTKTNNNKVHGRQIKSDIKRGLVHNLAAAGTSASIIILEK